jgi:hypothetical protein
MSESEKYEAQGRAYARLKETTANVATLKAELGEYVRSLRDVANLVADFINDPEKKNASFVPLYGHVKDKVEALPGSSTITRRMDDLREQIALMKELKDQVDKF